MTPTRRSFFASLAAVVVAPKVLKAPWSIYDPGANCVSCGRLTLPSDAGPFGNCSRCWNTFSADDHEAHFRMHLEGLRTGYRPMTKKCGTYKATFHYFDSKSGKRVRPSFPPWS